MFWGLFMDFWFCFCIIHRSLAIKHASRQRPDPELCSSVTAHRFTPTKESQTNVLHLIIHEQDIWQHCQPPAGRKGELLGSWECPAEILQANQSLKRFLFSVVVYPLWLLLIHLCQRSLQLIEYSTSIAF